MAGGTEVKAEESMGEGRHHIGERIFAFLTGGPVLEQ